MAISDGQMITGGVMSVPAPTVALAVAVVPQPSVTVTKYAPAPTFVRSCVVAPLLQLNTNGDTPPLIVNSTEPLLWPQPPSVTLVAKLMVLAVTVTVKEQVEVLPWPSFAVAVTVVVPIGNVEPEAGLYEMVAVPQLSEAVAA